MPICIDVSQVDWALLRRQKRVLTHLAFHSKDQRKREAFEGLLSLLDHIQDEAAKSIGEKPVFGTARIERKQ